MTFSSSSKNCAEDKSSIWLPTETWVDVFKFLSRGNILRNIQPTCHGFHAIAEKEVNNIHVISKFGDFVAKLKDNLPDANREYDELVANNGGAILAKHFRIKDFLVSGGMGKEQLRHVQMSVLRQLPDLFRGFILEIWVNKRNRMDRAEFMACLEQFHLIRPFHHIKIVNGNLSNELHIDKLLRQPVILNCPRLSIKRWVQPRKSTTLSRPMNTNIDAEPSADLICNWLHHLPPIEDNDQQKQQQTKKKPPDGAGTRILNFDTFRMKEKKDQYCNGLIERCKKLLRQSQSPSDQRKFLLNFYSDSQIPFRIDHPPTGEVLLLEQFPSETEFYHEYYACNGYRLRRCPIADLTTADQFYRDTFKPDKPLHFRSTHKNGMEVPTLTFNYLDSCSWSPPAEGMHRSSSESADSSPTVAYRLRSRVVTTNDSPPSAAGPSTSSRHPISRGCATSRKRERDSSSTKKGASGKK